MYLGKTVDLCCWAAQRTFEKNYHFKKYSYS